MNLRHFSQQEFSPLDSSRQISTKPDKTKRLFFALWPNAKLQNRIFQQSESILRPWPGKRVLARQLHVTLVFLGQVSNELQSCLRKKASTIDVAGFDLEMSQIGSFTRSQVIWIGPDRVSPHLLDLQQRLTQAQADCGLQPEARPFAPHMTLMRHAKSGCSNLRTSRIFWQVRDFALIESMSHPSGAEYRVLARWPLTKTVQNSSPSIA